MSDSTDPNSIRVNAGSMFIKGLSGTLVSFENGNVTAPGNFVGRQLVLQASVTVGTACASAGAGATYANTADGSLAVCVGGVWRALAALATHGGTCSTEGAFATNTATCGGLFCRSNSWTDAGALISNFKLMDVGTVTNVQPVAMPSCYNTEADIPVPFFMLYAKDEASADGTLIRHAEPNDSGRSLVGNYWTGGYWTIVIRESDTAVASGNISTVVAAMYCWYR